MIYILSLMSEEQLKAFLEKVKADTSLQEKLKAEGADPVAIAKEAGFIISADDLTKAQSELSLSDEELEGVAGGGGFLAFVQAVKFLTITKKN